MTLSSSQGLHTADIIAGYTIATKACLKHFDTLSVHKVEPPLAPTRPFAPSSTPFGSESAWQAGLKAKPWALNPQVDDFKNEAEVTAALRSAIAAKQYGLEGVLAPLVARACIQILPKDPTTFNVDNVRCVKIPGMTVNDSYLMKVLHVDGHRTKFGPCRSLPSTDESEDRRSDHASVEESGI